MLFNFRFRFSIRPISLWTSRSRTASSTSSLEWKQSLRTTWRHDSKLKSWRTGTSWHAPIADTSSYRGVSQCFGWSASWSATFYWCRFGSSSVLLGWVNLSTFFFLGEINLQLWTTNKQWRTLTSGSLVRGRIHHCWLRPLQRSPSLDEQHGNVDRIPYHRAIALGCNKPPQRGVPAEELRLLCR